MHYVGHALATNIHYITGTIAEQCTIHPTNISKPTVVALEITGTTLPVLGARDALFLPEHAGTARRRYERVPRVPAEVDRRSIVGEEEDR